MAEMVEINGSLGEGGGQILRTALSLSCITGKEVKFFNIRAGRSKPGLQAQHLTCVNALKEICSAEVQGAEISSQTLTFKPKAISAGSYDFNIGTAGSVTLLGQCILPVLFHANKSSTVTFTGGTHVPFAPLADYFSKVFLPSIAKMGGKALLKVEKVGLYPRGGGKAKLELRPCVNFSPVDFTKRGEIKKLAVNSTVCGLPRSIAERQLAGVKEILRGFETVEKIESHIEEIYDCGQGTFAFINAEYENCHAGFSALGKIGKKAEHVGSEAAESFGHFHGSGACIDEHLADQILLYCALAAKKGSSTFTTPKISTHFETNAWAIKQFMDVEINWEKGEETKNFLVNIT